MSNIRSNPGARLCTLACLAFALLAPTQATRADAELTPMGAEKAGSSDGAIPPWTGGITAPPTGFEPGKHHPDPFPDDKAALTITAQNAAEHRERLTPGQAAMLEKYPSFKMPIFPTRRTAASPQWVYEASLANRGKAQLVDDGNGIAGAATGIPFPQPENGLQAIWNHFCRYRGDAVKRTIGQAAVTASGDYVLLRYEDEYAFWYGRKGMSEAQLNNKLFYFRQLIAAPSRLAGRILLAHETLNAVREPRQVWVYNPGLRRVQRAPEVVYDSPPPGTDALRTVDQFDMYNGAPDRYDWKLLGKREVYVPYNAYRLASPQLKHDDILKPGHINQEHTRYELHRVWVVEATLKPGERHIYARRTFFLDEDSWQILLMDQYDNRGELWRYSEAHPIVYYEIPALWTTLELHYDLQSRRYLAFGLNNEFAAYDFSVQRSAADFNPDSLRRAGLR